MSEIKMLPLPEDAVEWLRQYGVANTAFQMEVIEGWFQSHARAVAEHNVKKRDAEIEALRAEALRIAGEMRRRMVGNASHHPKPVYGDELLGWAERLELALETRPGGAA